MNSSIGSEPILVRLSGTLAALQTPALVAVGYYLGAEAAFSVGTLSDRIFAPFWPPNIILFSALLLVPARRWPLFIAAAFPAHIIAEFSVGMPWPQLIVAFATNCVVALMSATAVRAFLGGPPWLDSLQKAFVYIVITAVACPAVAALGGAFVQILGGGAFENYWLYWSNWYVGNALAALTLGPVLLTFFGDRKQSYLSLSPAARIEAAICALALVASCTISFELSVIGIAGNFTPALLYLPLPVLLWAAIRFGVMGASSAILLVAVISIWRTLADQSPFLDEDPAKSVLSLQLFLASVSAPLLLLGAAIEQLKRAERVTGELAGSLLKAQDAARRTIARDLHESTSQDLAAAMMLAGQAETVVPEAAKPMLKELSRIIKKSINEVRSTSYLLYPPFLDESGLRPALINYVNDYSRRSGIVVELDVPSELEPISNETQIMLFRLIEEALTNVSRHSGSATARVRLTSEATKAGETMVLSIEDAGTGIPSLTGPSLWQGAPSPNGSRGLGLSSMRERLRQVGGRLEIDSTLAGTIIRAFIPMNPSATRAMS